MKLEIESTGKVTEFEGIPVRVWNGTTEKGTKCYVFVHRIAVHESENSEEFDRELKEMLPPGVPVKLNQVL